MLILYFQVNTFVVNSGQVFLGCTSTKQRIKCLAKGHNVVPLVKLQTIYKKTIITLAYSSKVALSW